MRAALLAACGNGAEDVRAAFDASPRQGSDFNLFLLLESREVVRLSRSTAGPPCLYLRRVRPYPVCKEAHGVIMPT